LSLFARSRNKKSPRRKSKGRRLAASPRWSWLLAFALAAVVLGVGLLQWTRTGSGQAVLLSLGSEKMYADVQLAVEDVLVPVLPGMRTGPADAAGTDAGAADHDWPAPQLGAAAAVRCRMVAVPDGAAWWEVQGDISEALQSVGARVLWGERMKQVRSSAGGTGPDEKTDLLRLDVGVSGRPTHTLVLHRESAAPIIRWGGGGQTSWARLAATSGPTVAILIDDWGYSRSEACRSILELPAPVTMAVLPGLSYSRYFALKGTELALPAGANPRHESGDDNRMRGRDIRLASGCFVEVGTGRTQARLLRRRREIMLHLPMEPQGYPETDPGPRAIMKGMDPTMVAARLDEALETLTNVTGVNNHMGSAATSDPETMALFMAALKERDLFFVDSLTSARSVAYAEAVKAGLPAARNRIFLDYDNEDESKIKANLEALVRSARSSGFALGIGHPHRSTAAVLAREIPRLAAQGVRFVTVSEMLALQEHARRMSQQDEG